MSGHGKRPYTIEEPMKLTMTVAGEEFNERAKQRE
jgi:hypothetical protein